MTDKAKYISTIIVMVLALVAVLSGGALALSLERQHKVEIGAEIRMCESQIANLTRENEELNVKIAQQENPAFLGRRASSRLIQPKIAGVVWAYENYAGGRVEFSGKNKGLVSFKAPERSSSYKKSAR